MNALLQKKLDELKNAQEFECWYLVKHSTNFSHLCYLVSFLKDYIKHVGSSRNLESYISAKVQDINLKKPSLGLSNNYRALRVAAFFGLIKMISSKYEESELTETFFEIDKRCGGEYEKTELYQDIITRQIEKMFVSSSIDEGKVSVRRDFAIFPIMFLNKVLLEIGKVTGKYAISMIEYRYLVATTKKYEDYLETMLYIKLLRDDPSVSPQFEAMRSKFDNRMNKAIELLDYLECNNSKIEIKRDKVQEVAQKVYYFESNKPTLTDTQYINFLCSTKALFPELGETIKANFLTPEWFREKAKEFQAEEVEAASLYVEFERKYGVDALNTLSGEDLLKNLFLGGNSDNLCHELEYVERNRDLFGSIKGGNAYKYPMFFDKEVNAWVTGNRYNPKQLTLNEAIIKGTDVRDRLVAAVAIIKEMSSFDTVEDYLSLYSKLYGIIPDIIDSIWVSKYFHMIFPQIFPVFYNKDWQLRVLAVLKIEPNDTAYGRFGQINVFVNECGISNVAFGKVFHKYCRNITVDEPEEDDVIDEVDIKRLTGGENIILYGVPGAGKSYTIKHEYCLDDTCIERLVFHPDYTYSDFVGQILPRIAEDGTVNYEFAPGPFTKLLRKAYVNPGIMFYLVIEEINRGNAPAIFGDIFQLLDRDKDGKSEYEITNADIAKIVYQNDSHKVSIPSNMSILCTMNTSDQNVFTLDTAFQRRWNMRLIKNKFGESEKDRNFASIKILDTDVTWEHFFTEINKIILSKNIRMTSSEDKRLGTHFVAEEDLEYIEGNEKHNRMFPEKVLKYLWDDAFKFTKEDIFDLEKVKSLEDVIELFIDSKKNERFRVFKENIYKTLVPIQ